MINSNQVTIIIPFLNSDTYRLKNLMCVLDSLGKTDIPVILCEQHNGSSFLSSFIEDQYPKIRYLSLVSASDKINKSKLVNFGVVASSTEFVWELDSDVILKWEDILKHIDPNQTAIKPFNYIVKLDRYETSLYFSNRNVKIKKGEMRDTVSKFGPLSFIIRKDIYTSSCGMNEDFEGWSWEDIEFAKRIEKNNNIFKINSSYGVHLWHPVSKSNEVHNLKILKNCT